jgi:hypothetical protein
VLAPEFDPSSTEALDAVAACCCHILLQPHRGNGCLPVAPLPAAGKAAADAG